MPLRFRKSIKIAPGVRLNVSKSGLSGTFGPRGASIGVGKRGVRANVGIPGTGLSYSQKLTGGGYVPAAQRRRGRGCLWLLLVGLGLFVLLVALSSPPAHAQQDITPPRLLDIQFNPAQIEFRPDEGWSEIVDGDHLDGPHRATMTIPQYAAYGEWELHSVILEDRVGNRLGLWKPEESEQGEKPSLTAAEVLGRNS